MIGVDIMNTSNIFREIMDEDMYTMEDILYPMQTEEEEFERKLKKLETFRRRKEIKNLR